MKKSSDEIISILFVIYIVVLLRITVFRSGIDWGNLFSGRVNYSFLVGYAPLIRSQSWFRIFYLFVGNIVWFVPMGLYLEKYFNMKWFEILAAGFGFSLFIEVMQFVLGTGVSELDDLVLNTLGAVIGGGIGKILSYLRRK